MPYFSVAKLGYVSQFDLVEVDYAFFIKLKMVVSGVFFRWDILLQRIRRLSSPISNITEIV